MGSFFGGKMNVLSFDFVETFGCVLDQNEVMDLLEIWRGAKHLQECQKRWSEWRDSSGSVNWIRSTHVGNWMKKMKAR